MAAGNFAARLKELRAASGLNQQQLADKAGLKIGAIRDLEQSINSPRWETVLALAAALGVDCTAFQLPATEATANPPAPEKATEPGQAKRTRGRPRKASQDAAPGVNKTPTKKRRGGRKEK